MNQKLNHIVITGYVEMWRLVPYGGLELCLRVIIVSSKYTTMYRAGKTAGIQSVDVVGETFEDIKQDNGDVAELQGDEEELLVQEYKQLLMQWADG